MEALTAADILRAGIGHMEARASTYDSQDGERSMRKAVAMFNACHGTNLTEAQGWHLLELVKHVRAFTSSAWSPSTRDSVEDGCAYGALRGEAMARGVVEVPAKNIAAWCNLDGSLA